MTKTIGRISFFLCAFGMLSFAKLGFSGSITAQVDKTVAVLGDEIEFKVTVSGSYKAEPTIANVAGLQIQKTGQASRTSIVGFSSVTREVEFTYQVVADQAGKFVLPSIALEVDGKKEQTAPINLTITAEAGGGAAQGNQPFFVERTLSSEQPVVGEAVTLVTKVFSTLPIVEIGGGLPDVKDFLKFSRDAKAKGRDETKVYMSEVKGVSYTVVEITNVLVPQKSGTINLPASQFEMRVKANEQTGRRSRNDDFFGFNFGPRLVQKKVRSSILALKVKPLPHYTGLTKFSGLVGNFFLTAELSDLEAKVGDSLTLTLTVKGDGLISDDFDALKFKAPPEFKVYPDRPQTSVTVTEDSGLQSEQVIKLALVPTKAGSYDLGDLVLSTFNQKLGLYADISATVGKVVIQPGDEQPLAASPSASNEAVVVQKGAPNKAEDLLPIKSTIEESIFQSKVLQQIMWFAFLTPVFLFLLLGFWEFTIFIYRRHTARNSAKNRFTKILTSVSDLKDGSEPQALLKIINSAFALLDGKSADSISLGDIRRICADKKMPQEFSKEAEAFYKSLERANYGSGDFSKEQSASAIAALHKLLKAMEQKLEEVQ